MDRTAPVAVVSAAPTGTGAREAIPTASAIGDAQLLLREYLRVTPAAPAQSLTNALGAPVYLKLDAELPTGSFKVRGALYALLRARAETAVREVVASSTGNHGAAVAYAATIARIPATIFLPRAANPVKRQRIEQLGGRVLEAGNDLTEAARTALNYAQENAAYYLDDATDERVPAGAATIGCELLEQVPDMRTVVVPIGDTALIRGVAAAVKDADSRIRVIGVQATGAPAYYLSWTRGVPVETSSCDTIADGLATRTPHAPNVAAIRRLVDDLVLVSDDELLAAMRYLLEAENVKAEPAGAAATAAALQLRRLTGTTVLLVTGGNVAPSLLERLGTLG